MEKKIYDILIFGNYTKDTIVSKTGTRYVDGGGFNYGAHAAANSGKSVAAVTRLAEEDKHVVEILESQGVDVFPTYTPSSTHMRRQAVRRLSQTLSAQHSARTCCRANN